MSEPLNVADLERLAESSLEPGAFGYFAGGAGDERCLRENVEAWRRLRLRPRVLVDVGGVTADTTVLGAPVSMPLLVAPTAFHRMVHPDGEPATARAAAAAGTIMCLSTLATAGPEEVAAAAPGAPRWLQLYVFRERHVTRNLVDQAVEHGFEAIVLTVDAPWFGRRERDLRTGFRIPEDVLVPSVAAAMGTWTGATPLDALSRSRRVSEPLNVADFERLAEERLEPGAFGYYAGGAGDELALAGNVEAWRALRLRPRVLVDVGGRLDGDDGARHAGLDAAPRRADRDPAARASGRRAGDGPGGRRGRDDHVPLDARHRDTRRGRGGGPGRAALVPALRLPRPRRHARRSSSRRSSTATARSCSPSTRRGSGAASATCAPASGSRRRSSCRASPPRSGTWKGATPLELLGAIDPTLSWGDLDELRGRVAASRRPEGDPDRRGRACSPASTAPTRSSSRTTAAASSTPSRRRPSCCPEIVEAVAGRIEVYVDGGIRRGSDVVKALALGARAVLVGRAPLWGLAYDGEAGARRVLELLRDEIELALALCGCASPEAVTPRAPH